MKKKILFVYPEMMMGGSTTSLLALLAALDPAAFDVDLILYKDRGALLSDIPKSVRRLPQASRYPDEGLRQRLTKSLILLLKGYLPRAWWNERRYHRRWGLDLQTMARGQVHLSRRLDGEYDAAIAFLELWSHAYLLTKVQAAKKIGWVHVDYRKAGFIPALDQGLFQQLDAIVAVSWSCRESLAQVFPELTPKMKVVENILSPASILEKAGALPGIPFDGLKIITVCRLTLRTKGLDRIVAAAKALREEGWRFLWTIVGDGPDRTELESLIAKDGLEDLVILSGMQRNPYPFLKSSDVFVLPSRTEGKPMAVTEAQILGLPVIITDYASAREQVEDGVDGIIAGDPSDEAVTGAITGALRSILQHPERLAAMKEQVRQKEFSSDRTLQNFHELIQQGGGS